MKCPKCRRYVEDGSESHQVCGWNVHEAPRIDRDARLALELRELTEQALAGLDEKGLARMPDEPAEEWHGRMRLWLRENTGFKRFGSAG